MSFFDEADEPRTAPRTAPRRRRTSGGRRPPHDAAVIFRRRVALIIGIVVAIFALGLLVNSCQSDLYHNSLKDYDDNVDATIQQSNSTSQQFFSVLTSGAGARSVYTSLNQTRNRAASELSHARGFSVPSGLSKAQDYLVIALQLRTDAIGDVAQNIEQALGGQTAQDAINRIATDMARLYASDVLYKAYALPLIVGALKAQNIAVGGLNGQPVEGGQFLPDLRWLSPGFIASQLHVSTPASTQSKPVAPGLHGHSLNAVAVGTTTLQTGSTNTVPAGSGFTLNFTNTGTNTETNVVCEISLAPTSGTGKTYTGQITVPQTTKGETTACTVAPSTTPPAGTYTLTATIKPVPGEKSTANNTLTFPVSYQ